MRAGDSAGCSGEANACSFFELLSGSHFDAGHVHVDGEEALSVVDDDAVAFIEERFGEDDRAGVGGNDGRAFFNGEVRTAMGAGEFFVEEASGAEGRRGFRIHWGDEVAGPLWCGDEVSEGSIFELLIFGDLFLFGVVGLYEVLWDLDFAGLEIACFNVD